MKNPPNPFMNDGKTPRCCQDVRESGTWPRYHQCSKKSVVSRDGNPYCKIHDPVEIKTRNKAKQSQWEAESRARSAMWEKERILRESFPKLVALLRQMVVLGDSDGKLTHDSMLADSIRKELAEAEKAL